MSIEIKPLTADTSADGYLTESRVLEVYERCYRDETVKTSTVQIEAWLLRHTFSVTQLYKSREEIIRMLLSVPAGFRSDVGEGGPVGLLTMRGDNTLWTTDMTTVEKLVALGIAANLVEFCAPRDMWHRLPGGLPYVRILITRFGVTIN